MTSRENLQTERSGHQIDGHGLATLGPVVHLLKSCQHPGVLRVSVSSASLWRFPLFLLCLFPRSFLLMTPKSYNSTSWTLASPHPCEWFFSRTANRSATVYSNYSRGPRFWEHEAHDIPIPFCCSTRPFYAPTLPQLLPSSLSATPDFSPLCREQMGPWKLCNARFSCESTWIPQLSTDHLWKPSSVQRFFCQQQSTTRHWMNDSNLLPTCWMNVL